MEVKANASNNVAKTFSRQSPSVGIHQIFPGFADVPIHVTAAVLCIDVALLCGPCALGNHRVDSPSTSLIGGHATRLQCVEPLIASLVEQNKRSEIPLADYKARVILLEQNCLT